MLCLLCAKPIEIWEPYHVVGTDWPGNSYRAHDRCIEQQVRRWQEIERDAQPPDGPLPDENPIEQ